MSADHSPGTVRDLTGAVVGEVDDPVAHFVELVRRTAQEEPVYVVLGTTPDAPNAPDGLEAALLGLGVPLRHDPEIGPSAQIISGSADEWDGEFRAAMIATLRVHGVIPPAVGP